MNGMELHKAEVLAEHRRKLVSKLPWSAALLSQLERDGFHINHVRSTGKPVWFVRAAPPQRLQEGFGLAPEVLIVLVRGELQAVDVRAASEEVIRSGLRLDGNLLVVADDRPSLADRLERIGGHGQRVAWVSRPDGTWPSLIDVFRRELPLFDAYEERDPVRGAQLVGREAEVAALRTRIVRGDAVGLFGLRKMGKTSVMRAVTDSFDPASAMRNEEGAASQTDNIVVWLDAGVLIERTVDALADELLAALDRRMLAAGNPLPTRRGRGLLAWKSAIESLLDDGRRFCVVIDEYDLLFEGEDDKAPIPRLNQFFRLVRGWSQMRQGQVSLVLIGRDATFLSAPEIDGVTNALLMWCTPMWIGPLSEQKATELLRKIGRRVGLEVGVRSAALALDWTGGHPLLQRQFGSALRAVVREGDATWNAPADPVCEYAVDRYRARDAVQEVLREITVLLRKRHPTSLDLLRELAAGRAWDDAVAERGGPESDAVRSLAHFGLLRTDHTLSGTLRWYVAQLPPEASALRRAS